MALAASGPSLLPSERAEQGEAGEVAREGGGGDSPANSDDVDQPRLINHLRSDLRDERE